MAGDSGIALLGLALLYMLSKKNGVPKNGINGVPWTPKVNGINGVPWTPTVTPSVNGYVAPLVTPQIGGVTYRTPELLEMAVKFEEHLEENKGEIEVYERKRRAASVAAGVAPPIPVLTKAIAYRAFLQEKPVRVTTGVYAIR